MAPTTTPTDLEFDAVIALSTELVRAHSIGASEVLKVVEERFGARAIIGPDGLIVQASTTTPALGLVVDLGDVPTCRDPGGGVVVGEPPRVSGCGARAMAGLAAFVMAAERHPPLRLEVVAGRAPTPGPARVWAGSGGAIGLVGDDAIFDLDLVDAGAVTVDLRRPGGAADLDGLVVAAGRAVAWRGPAHRSAVVEARASLRPLLSRLTRGDAAEEADLLHERCRLVAPPTPTAARLWCHVLPGRTADDVVSGLILAVDDPGIVVEVAASRSSSSTSPRDPLANAITARLAAEGLSTQPSLRLEEKGSPCDALRRLGTPCVGGVPLALHPAARAAVGTVDESVEVREIRLLAARVDDIAAALASDDRPRAADGGP